MASDEDRQHADRLRYEATRRLRVLEIRAARQGDQTDPATLTAIEDIRADIAGLDMIAAPSLSHEVREVVRKHFDDDLDFLIAQFGSITRRLTHSEEQIDMLAQQSHAAQTWRIAIADDVQALTTKQTAEEIARRRGQWLNRLLLIAIVLLVIAVLVIRALYS